MLLKFPATDSQGVATTSMRVRDRRSTFIAVILLFFLPCTFQLLISVIPWQPIAATKSSLHGSTVVVEETHKANKN